MDSTLWILDSTYRIPDPLSVELGLRIPIAAGLRIPGAEFRNPRVKFQNPKPKIPDSMSERLPRLHWWVDSLTSKWSKEWNRSALNKEEHFKNWMFIFYLHGSHLAFASSNYRAEPPRDRPLKESAKDIITVFCLTLSRYAIYSYGKNV